MVGNWEEDLFEADDDANGVEESNMEQRRLDDKRIHHMLARAPADRSWRRRGWLVLARSCPAKVQLAQDSDSGGGSGSCNDASGSHNVTGDQITPNVARLVGTVGWLTWTWKAFFAWWWAFFEVAMFSGDGNFPSSQGRHRTHGCLPCSGSIVELCLGYTLPMSVRDVSLFAQ